MTVVPAAAKGACIMVAKPVLSAAAPPVLFNPHASVSKLLRLPEEILSHKAVLAAISDPRKLVKPESGMKMESAAALSGQSESRSTIQPGVHSV